MGTCGCGPLQPFQHQTLWTPQSLESCPCHHSKQLSLPANMSMGWVMRSPAARILEAVKLQQRLPQATGREVMASPPGRSVCHRHHTWQVYHGRLACTLPLLPLAGHVDQTLGLSTPPQSVPQPPRCSAAPPALNTSLVPALVFFLLCMHHTLLFLCMFHIFLLKI